MSNNHSTTNTRRKTTENENLWLIDEVMGLCLKCGVSLMYQKPGRREKYFQVAHIYPLNPSSGEVALLANEERLHSDPNDLANLIPLCTGCHTIFDKPRTVEEYRELVALKKDAVERNRLKKDWISHPITDEISEIIERLCTENSFETNTIDLIYDPKRVDDKTDSTIHPITKSKIKSHVDSYFGFVQQRLADANIVADGTAEFIASQTRTYFLDLNRQGLSQQQIFEALIDWLHNKTQKRSRDACEIVVSFFVQNCEVFK